MFVCDAGNKQLIELKKLSMRFGSTWFQDQFHCNTWHSTLWASLANDAWRPIMAALGDQISGRPTRMIMAKCVTDTLNAKSNDTILMNEIALHHKYVQYLC